MTKGEQRPSSTSASSRARSRRASNPDGSVSFLTTIPGFDGLEFVVGGAAGKRTLVVRDAQHEYMFDEK